MPAGNKDSISAAPEESQYRRPTSNPLRLTASFAKANAHRFETSISMDFTKEKDEEIEKKPEKPNTQHNSSDYGFPFNESGIE